LIHLDLLWTAPEHLKQTKVKDKSVYALGSQHGDIYSFGIIMQEIIVRGAPFCMMGLTDEGFLTFSIFFLTCIF
jgi:guanylate cyclase 2F